MKPLVKLATADEADRLKLSAALNARAQGRGAKRGADRFPGGPALTDVHDSSCGG